MRDNDRRETTTDARQRQTPENEFYDIHYIFMAFIYDNFYYIRVGFI
jgi:hypothetical protein